jgi:hypothetical protein
VVEVIVGVDDARMAFGELLPGGSPPATLLVKQRLDHRNIVLESTATLLYEPRLWTTYRQLGNHHVGM